MLFITSVATRVGYEGENQIMPQKEFVELLQSVAEKVERSTGVYISCSVNVGFVVYKTEWGCPAEGESVYRLEASWNEVFASKPSWKEACLQLASELRDVLIQSTLMCSFAESENVYLKD